MGNVCAYLPVEYQKKATEQKRCLYFHIFSSISKGVFSCKRGDDLPEIIKTKDQTNEFFRSFYQNYFQGNVFVWIFLFAGKFSCEDFTGGCNFLYGIKKHFFTFRYVIITKVNGPSFIWKKRRRSIETNFKIGCALFLGGGGEGGGECRKGSFICMADITTPFPPWYNSAICGIS